MSTIHTILGGKVRLYKRANSRKWQCSTSLNGEEHRTTTKQESLNKAKDVAEDWYLGLREKLRAGELQSGKRFSFVAEQVLEGISCYYARSEKSDLCATASRAARPLSHTIFWQNGNQSHYCRNRAGISDLAT